jgi:hypothetical protein
MLWIRINKIRTRTEVSMNKNAVNLQIKTFAKLFNDMLFHEEQKKLKKLRKTVYQRRYSTL